MTASTMSSLIPSRSTFGIDAASVISVLAGGEGGGVCSMAMALSTEPFEAWAFFCRLLGCKSGDVERPTDDGVEDEDEDADEERPEDFDAAAARAACVTGMWMPRLGKERDLRRVL
jgi:hypothetical protein